MQMDQLAATRHSVEDALPADATALVRSMASQVPHPEPPLEPESGEDEDLALALRLSMGEVESSAQAPPKDEDDEDEDVALAKRLSMGVQLTCGVCWDTKSLEYFFRSGKGACSDHFCNECAYLHVKTKVLENQVGEDRLCCPLCPRPLSAQEVERALRHGDDGRELVELFQEKRLEAALGTGFRKCPSSKCNYHFQWSPGDYSNFKCPACEESFCLQCSAVGPNRPPGPGHEGMSCYQRRQQLEQDEAEREKLQAWLQAQSRDDEEFLKYLQQAEDTRPCPGCGHMIEKDEGCQHMTCKCGHEFCWDCGADRKVIAAHDNRWHKPSCPHYCACSETRTFQHTCPECTRLGRVCDFPSDDGYPQNLMCRPAMCRPASSSDACTASTVSSASTIG